MKKKYNLFFCFIFLSYQVFSQGNDLPSWNSEGIDMDALYAREEFRIGVQAFNRFNFNEAILLFENALRYRPGEALILEWLGRAYYRSGFEEAAIAIWQASAAAYGYSSRMGMLLSSKIETLRIRRSLLPVADDAVRYVESGRFVGRSGDLVLYRQPSAVLPREDGTTWVVAYGSNELLRIDVNGIIRDRKRGPLYGFDRPYDLARGPDGKLFLSEFRGGRVSVLSAEGDWQYYIGSKGIGPGQFMGPQNLAVDDEGYLYVVDFGNRRVSKFDPSGTFIASFGKNSANAEVLKFPTGIAVADGIVYVADKYSRSIHTFDRNGAYLGVFISEGLVGPESLRLLSDGRLLVTDTNRFLLVDPDTAIVRELGVIGNISAVRVTGSDIDRNGSILAADFKNGEVSILTRIEDKAAGLFVKIDRIVADEFPLVKAEILVQDRLRRPVVGLDQRNFLLTEYGSPVGGLNFLGASNLSTLSDAAIFIERSAESAARRDDLAAAVRDIGASGMRLVSLVSAGERPTKENLAASGGVSPARALEEAARGSASAYSPRWRFDLGLRLAATDLLAGEKKRALVFVGTGINPANASRGLGPLAFENYSLSELASYLANNGIVFYAVLVGGETPPELAYLCAETGGEALQLYRNEGIARVLASHVSMPSGYYNFSFTSSLPTDYGRAYLPLEAEVYLMERSGRDETGYFAPLE